MRVKAFLTAAATSVAACGAVLGATGPAGADARAAGTKVTVTGVSSTGGAPTSTQFSLRPLGDTATAVDPDAPEGPFQGSATVAVPGTYAVAVTIAETGRETVGARIVKVEKGKNVALTFDARQGHPITMAVSDDPDAELVELWAAPVVDGRTVDWWSADSPGALHVIPEPDPRLTLQVHGAFDGGGSSTRPIRYDLVQRAAGMPKSPAFAAARAGLARVDMTIGRPDTRALRTDVTLTPGAVADSPRVMLDAGKAARELVSFRTPGIPWLATVSANVGYLGARARVYTPGRHAESWGMAVWGPQPGASWDVHGTDLAVFLGNPLCPAPRFPEQDACDVPDARHAIALYRGGKLVESLVVGRTGPQALSASLGAGPQRYTFKVTTTRVQPGELSSRVTSVWDFTARALKGDAYAMTQFGVVQFRPDGLDARVGAKPGSTTRLPIRVGGPKAAVSSFALEVSFDGGRTWRAQAAEKTSGRTWQASVANPGKAGDVSLRAKVRDASGNTFTQTIIRAYRVG